MSYFGDKGVKIIGDTPIEPSVLDQDVLEQKLYKQGRMRHPTNQMVFVFGSNEAGRHGAGAAHFAVKYRGAKMGQGVGMQGGSYGIPTKDYHIQTLGLPAIQHYVREFIEFAKRTSVQFQVTQIGCGLAGLDKADIAPMFFLAPDNCLFDTEWLPYVAENHKFWGTFP